MDEQTAARADAYGTATATALVQLCRMLASDGAISPAQVEVIRHFALQGFDEVRERKRLSKETLEILETNRKLLDEMWGRVADAAGQAKPRK